jgi:ribosomal protein S27AE
MRWRNRFNPTKVPVEQRRCPKCGVPLFLSYIEPTDQADQDQRTFECTTCAYSETVIVIRATSADVTLGV